MSEQTRADGRLIRISASDLQEILSELNARAVPSLDSQAVNFCRNRTLAEIEEEHLRIVLDSSPTLEDAAKTLGINLSTLWRKRRALNIHFVPKSF